MYKGVKMCQLQQLLEVKQLTDVVKHSSYGRMEVFTVLDSFRNSCVRPEYRRGDINSINKWRNPKRELKKVRKGSSIKQLKKFQTTSGE
jgi:hypothetical protein